MYDSFAGRWTSEDPSGFAAGDANPDRYVGNGFPNYTDPSGLAGEPASPARPPGVTADVLLRYLDQELAYYRDATTLRAREPAFASKTNGWAVWQAGAPAQGVRYDLVRAGRRVASVEVIKRTQDAIRALRSDPATTEVRRRALKIHINLDGGKKGPQDLDPSISKETFAQYEKLAQMLDQPPDWLKPVDPGEEALLELARARLRQFVRRVEGRANVLTLLRARRDMTGGFEDADVVDRLDGDIEAVTRRFGEVMPRSLVVDGQLVDRLTLAKKAENAAAWAIQQRAQERDLARLFQPLYLFEGRQNVLGRWQVERQWQVEPAGDPFQVARRLRDIQGEPYLGAYLTYKDGQLVNLAGQEEGGINRRLREHQEDKNTGLLLAVTGGALLSLFAPYAAGYTIPQTLGLMAAGGAAAATFNAGRQLIEMQYDPARDFRTDELVFSGMAGTAMSGLGPLAYRYPYVVFPAGTAVGGFSLYNEVRKGRPGVGLYDFGASVLPYGSKTVRTGVLRRVDLGRASQFLSNPTIMAARRAGVLTDADVLQASAVFPAPNRTALTAHADSFRGLPTTQRPGAVAELQSPAGTFLGRSNFRWCLTAVARPGGIATLSESIYDP
jgi:hypothetical protein